MKTDTHGNGNGLNDLYILPETDYEEAILVRWLPSTGYRYRWQRSDNPGNDWHGKRFIVVPFGESLLPDLVKLQATMPNGAEVKP